MDRLFLLLILTHGTSEDNYETGKYEGSIKIHNPKQVLEKCTCAVLPYQRSTLRRVLSDVEPTEALRQEMTAKKA
jgi:hypothetical protein